MSRRNGRNARSPAFQFYPGDFLSDSKVASMNIAERGLYITLLCHQWIDGPLSSDPDLLARLGHTTREEFDKVWPMVSRCFQPCAGKCLQNPRLEREREFQAEGRARRLAASAVANAAKSGTRMDAESEPNRSRIGSQSSPPLSPTPQTPHPTPDSLSPTPDSLRPAVSQGRASRAAPPEIPASLDMPLIREALDAYQVARREQGHRPLGPVGLGRLYAKLEAWGPSRALAALSHSTANGYQGVFEPGGQSTPRAKGSGGLDALRERLGMAEPKTINVTKVV